MRRGADERGDGDAVDQLINKLERGNDEGRSAVVCSSEDDGMRLIEGQGCVMRVSRVMRGGGATVASCAQTPQSHLN